MDSLDNIRFGLELAGIMFFVLLGCFFVYLYVAWRDDDSSD